MTPPFTFSNFATKSSLLFPWCAFRVRRRPRGGSRASLELGSGTLGGRRRLALLHEYVLVTPLVALMAITNRRGSGGRAWRRLGGGGGLAVLSAWFNLS